MTVSASANVVFKSFVGDDNVGTRPIQLPTSRNMKSDTMKGARNLPLFPIIASIWPCSQPMISSTTICHPRGTSERLRVARKAIRMTMAIVSQVISSVSQLKVKPASCTVSRTPISCILPQPPSPRENSPGIISSHAAG